MGDEDRRREGDPQVFMQVQNIWRDEEQTRPWRVRLQLQQSPVGVSVSDLHSDPAVEDDLLVTIQLSHSLNLEIRRHEIIRLYPDGFVGQEDLQPQLFLPEYSWCVTVS